MNKKVYLFAAVAALFAACSNNDGAESAEKAQAQAQAQQIAVGFDAYQGRALTRAVTDLAALQATIATGGGFGVFAYYTDNNDYDGQAIPNFMYNQGVEWDTNDEYWKYEPVKYWPNEYGDDAKAEETDRISFFAYGPYKAAVASTGKVAGATKNIIGFTRNNYAGDPMVKYVVDLNPATSVDLVWGTIGTNTFAAKDGTTYTAAALQGFPWLNVKRPANTGLASDGATSTANENVKFQFEHALASLNVQVDAYVDGTDATNALDKNTRIWIRSISFEGLTTQGALNLNNIASKVALWKGINGDELVSGETVTIYDGRKDGKEGTAAATNEKVTGLNDQLIQSEEYDTYDAATGLLITGVNGVTKTAVNLFKSATLTDPIYVIPSGDDVKVTIAYDVETYDANLSTKLSDNILPGSSISNVITQSVAFAGETKLENGKAYTLKLHLGMNSVKFDALVTGWDDVAATDTNLPTN